MNSRPAIAVRLDPLDEGGETEVDIVCWRASHTRGKSEDGKYQSKITIEYETDDEEGVLFVIHGVRDDATEMLVPDETKMTMRRIKAMKKALQVKETP